MRRLALVAAALAVLASGCSSPEPAGPLVGDALVEALREGGYVLFLRHTETDSDESDDPEAGDDCTRQRGLNEAGRQDARDLGAAVEQLGVPIGEVLASPFCRTVETAELAFGRATVDDGLLPPASDGSGKEQTAERLRELLSDEPREGTNTVLVGHVSNLALAAPYEPEEGGTVVLRPDGDGFVLAGEVSPQGWQRLAR